MVAGWLFPQIGILGGAGIAMEIVRAAIGAIVVLVIVGFIKRA